jgi:hypothetical protein
MGEFTDGGLLTGHAFIPIRALLGEGGNTSGSLLIDSSQSSTEGGLVRLLWKDD